jgi:hypothetical protein
VTVQHDVRYAIAALLALLLMIAILALVGYHRWAPLP